MLIRRESQWSSKYLRDAEETNPKIERVFNTEIVEAHGTPGKLTEIVVKNHARERSRRSPVRQCLFSSARVRTANWSRAWSRPMTKGFIITGMDLILGGKRPKGWTLDRDPFILETSVPGIFAAGDVRQGANNRVASATGEGGFAIAAIQRYLSTL